MFFPRGDKHNKRFMGERLMFCASNTPSSDGILISRKWRRRGYVAKTSTRPDRRQRCDNLHLAVLFN